MDRNLHLDFLRVTEAAALACAKWVGKGDRSNADQAACEGMRSTLNEMAINGTIVIGEGERDEAPMLYIGEKVGTLHGAAVSIAVDPLEGTNLCANGTPNAIAVLAACLDEYGWLMHAPDCYMEKLVAGQANQEKTNFMRADIDRKNARLLAIDRIMDLYDKAAEPGFNTARTSQYNQVFKQLNKDHELEFQEITPPKDQKYSIS